MVIYIQEIKQNQMKGMIQMKEITLGYTYIIKKKCKVKGKEYKIGDEVITYFHGQLFVMVNGDHSIGYDFPIKKFSTMLNKDEIVEK